LKYVIVTAVISEKNLLLFHSFLFQGGPDLIFFCVQIYPDESHGLEGVLGHLHHSMEDHLAICLGNVTLGTILEPLHHNRSHNKPARLSR
jgi:hypothetical protein